MKDRSPAKKLLVLDIDGTLVNDQKKITPRTRMALRRAMEAGHRLMIASGRPTPGVMPYVRELELDRKGGYSLTFNGARVQDCRTGEELYTKKLSGTLLPDLLAFAEERDMGIITYTEDLTGAPGIISGRRLDDRILWTAKINGLKAEVREDFLEYVDYDVYKVLMTTDPSLSEAYMKDLQEICGDRANVIRSEAFYVEIMARGIDKAKSLDAVTGRLGIRREDTICCGDGFNDISLVRYGGIGVAMGNAREEVKAAADYVTASNEEDGIAEVVERFLL